MAIADIGSIMEKAEAYMDSAKGKKIIRDTMNNIMTGKVKKASEWGGHTDNFGPEEAAEKFIYVLRRVIDSRGYGINATRYGYPIGVSPSADGMLGPTAVRAAKNLDYILPGGDEDGEYNISISFGGNLKRASLNPGKYSGVYNIIGLLNKGYATKGGRVVVGVWEGHGDGMAVSLPTRSGSHFIQEAIDIFMREYASEYGVIRIDTSGDYSDNGTMTITTV